MHTFIVETSKRIDKLLVEHYPNHSRSYFQYLIDKGSVTSNGKQVKKRTIPHPGDVIEVFFLTSPEIELKAQNIPLDILYEDDHLICINKPSGMVVHPAPGHPENTFVNALLYHCHSLPPQDLRPGIVHRLDRYTSGALIAAKTTQTHQKLITAFSSRTVHKEYLAITVGNPGKTSVHAPIGRNPIRRKEMAVVETGREALTLIETLSTQGDFALVKAEPVTGRTHQIRVHLKHLGTPVLGDPIYGSEKLSHKLKVPRQLLHAHRISLTHPILGNKLEILAPPPLDLQKWLKQFNYQ